MLPRSGMFQLPTLLTLCFLVPLAPSLAEVRDSADLLTEPGLESPSDYGAVTTYPDWADVRNKPATATRWPRFNEVLDRPAYYPTAWSQISGKPEHFSPDEHEHDDRYLRLTGGSLSGTLRADRIGIGMHSGEAFLSIAGNRNERPDILFDSHGLIAANQNMTFVIEDDEVNNFTFRNGGLTHSETNLLASIRHNGDIEAQGALIANNGLRVKTDYIPGNVDITDNWPRGISYTDSLNGDTTYPAVRGTALTVNSSSARVFQLFGRKSEGSGRNEMYYRSCHDRELANGNFCTDWSKMTMTQPGENGIIVGEANGHPDWESAVLRGEGNKQKASALAGAGFVTTPWVYARAIEADARANTPTIIALGDRNGYTGEDQIGFITNGDLRMLVNRNGRVGIGTDTPQQLLHVDGNVFANSYATPSDIRLKDEIKPLHAALERISNLNGISYIWSEHRERGEQIGLVAQQVAQVFPEAVLENEEDGYLSVNYSVLVSPLVEAVKELDHRTDDLLEELENTREENRLLRDRLEDLEALVATIAAR